MTLRFSLLLTMLLSVDSVFAQNHPPSEPVSVAISLSIPPWVMSGTDSGIEIDILREAFATQGLEFEPVYLPFARAVDMFNAGEFDGLINARPGLIKTGYLSDIVVTFQNVAVSIRENGFPEDIEIDFLQDKTVVAFQKAHTLLGPKYSEMAQTNEKYQEVSKQRLQLNLLFLRNIDFIVLDKSIFGYHWNEAIQDHATNRPELNNQFLQPVTFHYLFEPSPYAFAFKSKEIRDQFNEGLRQLKNNGRYDEILRTYDSMKDLYTNPAIK